MLLLRHCVRAGDGAAATPTPEFKPNYVSPTRRPTNSYLFSSAAIRSYLRAFGIILLMLVAAFAIFVCWNRRRGKAIAADGDKIV